MQLLKSVAPWLLLVFLGQHLSSAARNKSRGADTSSTPAPGRAQRSKSPANGRGKFVINKMKMQCTWAAKDVKDTVRLSVKCENPEARVKGGVTDMQCDYNGKPDRCPSYQSDPKGFWKQLTRAFKRLQDKVCADQSALVKSGKCKRAPRDAHFKLDITTSVKSAQSGGISEDPQPTPPPPPPPASSTSSNSSVRPTACAGKEQQRRKAEEYCGGWASLCTFAFTMLQNDGC